MNAVFGYMAPAFDMAIPFDEVASHPPVAIVQSFFIRGREKVSDTRAEGGHDVIGVNESADGIYVARGHARVERGEDGSALVLVRTAQGEFAGFINAVPEGTGEDMEPLRSSELAEAERRANAAGKARMEELEAAMGAGMERLRELAEAKIGDHEHYWRVMRAFRVRWLASLHQRQRQARDTARPVPIATSALSLMSAAGRFDGNRAEAVHRNIAKVAPAKTIVGKAQRDMVTVTLAVPRSKNQKLRLTMDTGVFPEFAQVDRRELPAAVGEELARRMNPRGLQAVMAGMSIVYAEQGLRLEEGERVPKAFRTHVMDMIGMPSRRASQAQRANMEAALELLLHAEVEVTERRTKKTEFIPLLARTAYADSPDSPERRATRVIVNPDLMPEMAAGRILRIPEALLRVPDEADRSGVMRLMGMRAAFRLAMGTGGHHEGLRKFIDAAGLSGWVRGKEAEHGPAAALDELRRALDRLRALPHGEGSTDIVGGMSIVGERLSDARVEYHAPPSWAVSSA